MVRDERSGGPHFARFCEHYIRQTKGRWAGAPLVLEPWQAEFWDEALELDPGTGLRVYSEVGLGIPRKNSKSTMASAAGLYFLTADGEAEPEVYIAAAARGQAGIVLGQARTMARRSARLMDELIVQEHRIKHPRSGGIMRSLSADAGLQHGLNPSANIIDEIHAHKNPDLYTALTTGTGAREQPFTLWITTAGVAGQGLLGSLYQQMFDGPGELEDRGHLRIYRDRGAGVLIWWYGLQQDADIEDPSLWRLVNPLEHLQRSDYLDKQFARLKGRGQLQVWRQLHLNQFVEAEEAWLPPGAWNACRADDELAPDLPIGVAIDRAQTSELAAVSIAQRQGERCVVRTRVFVPDALNGRVDAGAIRAHLRELRTAYPAPMASDPDSGLALLGPAFAYDPTNFGESAELLEGEGLNMVRFPQTDSLMAPATQVTSDLVMAQRLAHDGDAVLAEHVGATLAKVTERGTRVTKLRRGSARKNPAAIAAVMAIAVGMAEPPAPRRKPVYGGARW